MLFEKTIQKIIDTKLDKTIKAYQKEIKELKAAITLSFTWSLL